MSKIAEEISKLRNFMMLDRLLERHQVARAAAVAAGALPVPASKADLDYAQRIALLQFFNATEGFAFYFNAGAFDDGHTSLLKPFLYDECTGLIGHLYLLGENFDADDFNEMKLIAEKAAKEKQAA
ncbi:hypothetical protein K7H91_12295 [Martelella mediterranea]|uniref:hypothetical protein n=1 Tax=Martelella mediterranea TaxID=293089 RepID=UPI001E3009DC|nr:hypothetical protein [Martelella mediterranea]MCD1634553.1 hypothetical protein [Martelella mediterranea]